MRIKLPGNKNFRGLCAQVIDGLPSIYFTSGTSDKIMIAQSVDGYDFKKTPNMCSIFSEDGHLLNDNVSGFKISPLFKKSIMFYGNIQTDKSSVSIAESDDFINWKSSGNLPEDIGLGLTVENYVYNDSHVFYFGGKSLTLGLTPDGMSWDFKNIDLEVGQNFSVDYVLKTSQGIFVLYHHYVSHNSVKHLEVKVVCFDRNDPGSVLWHTKSSLWNEPEFWKDKGVNCIGCFNFDGKLLSYWDIEGFGIYLITYPLYENTPAHEHDHYKLDKHSENPILKPVSHHDWENEAVFNSAAFYDGEKVYLIYRAVGYGYISVLGYAESKDGIKFGNRLEEPIFTGNEYFDTKRPDATFETARKYISGGGYGGCEDPRITKIDDKLYMIYVAFNGWDPPRLALTSILYDDFVNHRFLWEKPVLISPPGIVDKSGCVLPEKINGKYVIFHRVFPNILIDYVDDLNFDGTTWLKGQFKIEPRPTMWDSRKVGTGAPPIKTKDGWLMIYQAVTDNDDSKYKIGAMLLDLNDPAKVLYRTNQPIIEPTEYYENHLAKFGVVYPCGAVIKDGKLLVYYGGSDSVTCLATADLDGFLKELKSGNGAHLSPVKFNA